MSVLPTETVYEVVVEGLPITPEAVIIGALVRRLGGSVRLEARELTAVQGVVFWEAEGGVQIDAGNFNGGVEPILGGEPGADAPEPGATDAL
jgi:hypothetical protein